MPGNLTLFVGKKCVWGAPVLGGGWVGGGRRVETEGLGQSNLIIMDPDPQSGLKRLGSLRKVHVQVSAWENR